MKEKDCLLIIFQKNKILGEVKTRLAKTIGDKKAMYLYEHLINYIKNVVNNLSVDKAIFYNNFIDAQDSWNNKTYFKELQSSGDIGLKMKKAFEWGFKKKYKRIVLIGTDCYMLQETILLEAFETLKTVNATIGKAIDGGYYLIGMTVFYPSIFENKQWSTAQVYPATIQDFQNKNITFSKLTVLRDLDDLKDLQYFQDLYDKIIEYKR